MFFQRFASRPVSSPKQPEAHQRASKALPGATPERPGSLRRPPGHCPGTSGDPLGPPNAPPKAPSGGSLSPQSSINKICESLKKPLFLNYFELRERPGLIGVAEKRFGKRTEHAQSQQEAPWSPTREPAATPQSPPHSNCPTRGTTRDGSKLSGRPSGPCPPIVCDKNLRFC